MAVEFDPILGQLRIRDAGGSGAVTSVNSRTGAVVLTSADVGLANVDNTSDVNKPVSTAQATADSLRVLKAGDTMTSTLNVTLGTITDKGIVVTGAASQTGDLQQWQNNVGGVLASVLAGGSISTTGSVYSSILNAGAGNNNGAYLNVLSNSAASPVVIVQGAASQSAALTRWQSSAAATLAQITPNGGFVSTTNEASAFGRSVLASTILTVGTAAAGNTGLVVQGVASQTSDLQQWQNSAGTVFHRVAGNGQFSIGASSQPGGNTLFVSSSVTGNIGLIVRGVASQTADLQQWQNSAGTALTYVTAAGGIVSTSNASGITVGTTNNFGAKLGVSTVSNGNIGISVRAAGPSQTANLQEWQDSTGAVLASVSPTGALLGVSTVQGTVLNATTGFQVAGGATTGTYLRGNGTNYVSSTIQAADVPTLNQNTTGTASNVTGTVLVANGGTGATTLTGILKGNGTAAVTTVAGPTGVLVGDTDTQTLTNKTLTAGLVTADPSAALGIASKQYVDGKAYGTNTQTTAELPTGTINSSNTVFTTAAAKYVAGTLEVWIDGVYQRRTTDYTETTPASGVFTMATAPVTGQVVQCAYFAATSSAGNASTVNSISAATTATANTLVALDGNKLLPADGIIAPSTDHISLQAGTSKLVKTTALRQDNTTNTYQVGNTVILTGWVAIACTATTSQSKAITFGVTFTQRPIVTIAYGGDQIGGVATYGAVTTRTFAYAVADSITTGGFRTVLISTGTWSVGDIAYAQWTAIGEI